MLKIVYVIKCKTQYIVRSKKVLKILKKSCNFVLTSRRSYDNISKLSQDTEYKTEQSKNFYENFRKVLDKQV